MIFPATGIPFPGLSFDREADTALERKSASKRGPKQKPKADALGAEDPACARAWDRLDQAEKRLLDAGGKKMETALDGFYDAWLERLAVMAEGGPDGGTSTHLENAMALLTRVAATPQAEQATAAFLEVAILEVEAAVLRSLRTGVPNAAMDSPSTRWEVDARGRTGNA
jgi:hypothetical protein